MNKKIVLGAIIASFVMIGVSIVTAVNAQTKSEEKQLEKIDSPLFKIRTKDAINEEKTSLRERIKNIISNFLEGRVFLNLRIINRLRNKDEGLFSCISMCMPTHGPPKCTTYGELRS